MIQVTPHMRILLAREPLDFRNGIDGTAAVCRRVLNQEPIEGAVFLFRNRSSTMIRALVYDGQGYWLMTKRMSQGKFRFWSEPGAESSLAIAAHQLHTLLMGGDWRRLQAEVPWRAVSSQLSIASAQP